MHYRFLVKGIVQGVGFRPYIFRKAKALDLTGSVRNIGYGVEIIVNDKDFMHKLDDLPPLARIDSFQIENIEGSYIGFKIVESSEKEGATLLPPDIFMCDECKEELKDRSSRRNGYYFITCTNCGPRFSMIRDYPYDRKNTSMDGFRMCSSCEEEYEDPMDRRFHAQTIACKNCGPRLFLKDNNRDISEKDDIDTIQKAANLLRDGKVIAIKGVGGFHLVSNTDSVNLIRGILNRPDKPFALLAKDIDMVKRYCIVSEKEKEILTSPIRPIVILEKKDKKLLSAVSELSSLGFMLPYTGIHQLLFDLIDEPLVMTSYNIPGKPMIIDEGGIEGNEHVLYHGREIVNRVDDSVIKVIKDSPLVIRRSRGFAPLPITLNKDSKEVLAFGAEMNNTICVTKKNQAFISQHIGNTSRLETMEFHDKTIETFMKIARTEPKIMACDMHPYYNTSDNARKKSERDNTSIVEIQHHKAHIAGAAAEHHLTDYAGIAMDGTGYGEDGAVWGGEVFDVKDDISFERVGHLEYQPMLGGDSAAKNPKKMLLGILSKTLSEEELIEMDLFDKKETRLYIKQLKGNFNIVQTSSSGRVLDAVSSLLGLCDERTYDGRPAMLLESIATEPLKLKPIIEEAEGRMILMTTPLFRFLIDNPDKNKGRLAATAQSYLAEGLLKIAEKRKKPIVFSGGVAYNKMITGIMLDKGVLINKEVPSGDGGISFGQAYIAGLIDRLKNN